MFSQLVIPEWYWINIKCNMNKTNPKQILLAKAHAVQSLFYLAQ